MTSREITFIDTVLGDATKSVNQLTSLLKEASQTAQSYTSAVSDYLQAKKQYCEYLEKYQDPSNEQAVMTSIPGLSAAPSFSNEEMSSDSDEMRELGELVMELNQQIETLEEKFVSQLRKVVGESKTLTNLKDRSSQYLDQLISKIGGVYDAGGLAGMIDNQQLPS